MIQPYLNTVRLSSMQSFKVNVKQYPASIATQLRGQEANLGRAPEVLNPSADTRRRFDFPMRPFLADEISYCGVLPTMGAVSLSHRAMIFFWKRH